MLDAPAVKPLPRRRPAGANRESRRRRDAAAHCGSSSPVRRKPSIILVAPLPTGEGREPVTGQVDRREDIDINPARAASLGKRWRYPKRLL
ncbi:hypothetical protein KCP69_13180 [Salmonella enterica subsp. enterica]|nr:hypothetical protein KCP69_13180 [Salmonella enterica subsp. enterica]